MLIDTHTHLLSEEFDNDRDEVIKRAKDKGVEKFIEVGYDEKYSTKLVDFVEYNDDFFGAIGIHPHNAIEFTNTTLKNFEKLIKSQKIIAIGEIGLDYYRDLSPRDTQEKIFRQQIELSQSLEMPIIIHCREAKDNLKKILKEYQNLTGIIHSFSGTLQDAYFYIERGFLLGISGVVTYKNSLALKNVVKEIDMQNIVFETDCPYLPPTPYRGKRNEPSYLNFTKEEVVKLKEIDSEIVDKITAENINRIFKIFNK
ncbi:MAG: TatD family hydrolase [Elusimicrobiota bacterium]|jgi:TatD DNase family protein|nr:TatD family hydrolase [Elusimicrobiota bacterium]